MATFSQAILQIGHEIIHATNLRKVEPTNSLVIAALIHIQNHSVNATDAIVLHAALGLAQHRRSRGDDLILVASDRRLLRAAQAEGLGTFDPEIQDQRRWPCSLDRRKFIGLCSMRQRFGRGRAGEIASRSNLTAACFLRSTNCYRLDFGAGSFLDFVSVVAPRNSSVLKGMQQWEGHAGRPS